MISGCCLGPTRGRRPIYQGRTNVWVKHEGRFCILKYSEKDKTS